MGGFFGGIFSPTEGGAVGAFGALAISVPTRRVNIADLLRGRPQPNEPEATG